MATHTPSRRLLLDHPLATALGVLVLLGVLRALVDIHQVLLLGFFGLLVAVVFSFPVGPMARVMPRGLAVIITLLASLGGLVGVVGAGYPVVARQVTPLIDQIPAGLRRAQLWLSGRHGGPVSALPQPERVAAHVQTHLGEWVSGLLSHVVPVAFSATEAVLGVGVLVVLAAFLVYEPATYRRGLRQLVPARHEALFDEAWRRVAHDLRHWVGGTLVAMAAMGTFAAIGLAAIGVQGWLVLGVLTFLGTFVPYVGALSSAVPGLIVALAQSPTRFLEACGVYLGVHVIEGYLVQPVVMRRAVELEPALLLFGQACLGAVFGLMGVVVATPLIVCGRALVQLVWVEGRLGKGGRRPPTPHA